MRNSETYPARSWALPFLELRDSKTHGKGVFTSRPIKKGEVVIVWGGIAFTQKGGALETAKNPSIVGIGEDLYLSNPKDEPFSIDDHMNHSCDPNIWMQDEVTLIARRDIAADEELTADYAMWFAHEDYTMEQPCNCNAEACRKFVAGRDWKLENLQQAYKGHFSPFINERVQKLRAGDS